MPAVPGAAAGLSGVAAVWFALVLSPCRAADDRRLTPMGVTKINAVRIAVVFGLCIHEVLPVFFMNTLAKISNARSEICKNKIFSDRKI